MKRTKEIISKKILVVLVILSIFGVCQLVGSGVVLQVKADHPDALVRRIMYEFAGATPSVVAERADMYMCHYEQGWKVPRIHALNPNTICLLYRNIREVYESSSEFAMFRDKDWILKDSSGTLIKSTVFTTNYIVDPGNPDYQQWVANWIKTYIIQYGFNGTLPDNVLPSSVYMWSTSPKSPINPRTKAPWTSAEFKEAVIALVGKIKATIGSKLVISNGIYTGTRFFQSDSNSEEYLTRTAEDGNMCEGWMLTIYSPEWYTEKTWLEAVNYPVWLENNYLDGGHKLFLPVAQNAEPYSSEGASLPAGCTKNQYVTFSYCSLLLAAKSRSYYINYGNYIDNYVDTLLNTDLGSPLGNYYMIQGTHVYARDFSKVKVLVNPTDQSYSVNLDGIYLGLDGTRFTSPLTVSPHTGVILRRTSEVGAVAHVVVEHTYRGDLVVDVGVGNPSGPLWSRQVWNRQGGSADNLDLTVDLSAATIYLPPSETHQWYLKVYDGATGDQGRIAAFTITYLGVTSTSTDTPVPINDLQTSYAYIRGLPSHADVLIEHTYRGDLVVDIGVGDPVSPSWSQRIWNRGGGNVQNLSLTVDLTTAIAYLPPSEGRRWFLKVYDGATRDEGRIVTFTITYQGKTYSSTDVPVPVNDFETSYAYIPSLAQAHVYIQHTYRGDLIVDVGVGSTSTPLWSKRVWSGTGGNLDNLDLYADVTGALAYLPPSATYTWWVKVYDRYAGDTGKITAFTIAYEGITYTSPNVPVPISDLKTSYAYIKG